MIDIPVESSGNLKWMPASTINQNYTITYPEDAAGAYSLKFRIVIQSGKDFQKVDIGVKESLIDTEGFVELGEVEI
jgi:hypothetical protein